MEEKIYFINEYRSGAWSMTDLCAACGISRTLGYKYLERFQKNGIEGLLELSRTPIHSPNKTPADIEAAIIALRREKPHWGSEKLLVHLARGNSSVHWPAISTGNLILKRNGLVLPRRRIRRIIPRGPIFNPQASNDIWSADYKGKFRMGCKQYCNPLTIADSFDRYLFAAEGFYYANTSNTKLAFTKVFREHGIPKQLHTDNGAPFGSSQSLGRLTKFSVWIIELGIDPVYSDPGHPEQNGRHERMHRDLKAQATKPPAYSLHAQQILLDEFRKEYNEVRPHKALNNLTPAQVHVPSSREFPEKISEWLYPEGFDVQKVYKNGAIRWGSYDWVMVSTALIDKYIGLEELGNGISRVFFREKLLGYLDESILRIQDDQGRQIRMQKV